MQQLTEFVDTAIAIADYRNVAIKNPVPVTIPKKNGENIVVVVSYKEPNNATLPMNVAWIVLDSSNPDYRKVLRRTSTIESARYRHTWQQVTSYDALVSEPQVWDVSGNLSFGEVDVPEAGAATKEVRGLFRLGRNYNIDASSPIVVSDTDPRLKNPRNPLPHTHPKLPVTMIKGADGINAYTVKVSTVNTPISGMILALKEPGANEGEWLGYWRRPTAADIVYDGPMPVSVTINGPVNDSIDETVPYTFTADIVMDDDSTLVNVNVVWSIIGGSQYAAIGGSSGQFVSNDIDNDQVVRVEARYTHPESGNTVVGYFDVNVIDNTIPINLLGIEIQGPETVNENSSASYTVKATFDDGNSTGITPNTFTSSNLAAGTFNALSGTLVVGELSENQVTNITATYTFNGVTKIAELTVTALDVTTYPQSATIVGPNSVDESDTANYSLRITYTDATIKDEVDVNWVSSNEAAGTINKNTGLFEAAGNLFDDELTTLSGSFTLNGRTVTATKQVTVKDTTIYPRSAVIVGTQSVNENKTTQYQFRVTYTDNSSSVVSVTNWALDNPNIGSINPTTGMFVAVEDLQADESGKISASYTANGVTVNADLRITVKDDTVYPTSARIVGNPNMDENDTQTLLFEVTYSDSSTENVTVNNWASSDTSAATIGQANGIVLSNPNLQSNRSTTISASYTAEGRTVSATLVLTIVDTTDYPVSAVIVGANTVKENTSSTYTLEVTFMSGAKGTKPTTTWVVTGGATINTSGVLLAPVNVDENSEVTITASYEIDGIEVHATKQVTIVDTTVYPVSARIVGSESIYENTTSQYQLEVTFTDASVGVVSVNSWASSNPQAGTIGASSGLLSAISVTVDVQTTITASYTLQGITVSAEKVVLVKDGTVYPVSATIVGLNQINEGGSSTYTLKVSFTDGSSANVPVTDWASSDTSVGVINPSTGVFQATQNLLADGTTELTASYRAEGTTVTGSKVVTVKDVTAYPKSATISGIPVVDAQGTATYTMNVTFDDNSSRSVDAVWSSSNPVAGSVDENGLFTANDNTTDTNIETTLTATYTLDGRTVSATRTIAVKDTTNYPASIVITGPATVQTSTFENGSNIYNYAVSVTYRDGTTVTNQQAASWSVEGRNEADVVGTIDGTGKYTTKVDTSGETRTITIKAVYEELGKTLTGSKSVSMQVVPYPVSIELTGPATVPSNSSRAYTAKITVSNGQEVMYPSTFTTDASPAVASISNSGTLTTQGVNVDTNITVTAQHESHGLVLTDQLSVTVAKKVEMVSIESTPASPTVSPSGQVLVTTIATFSDGSTQDITEDVMVRYELVPEVGKFDIIAGSRGTFMAWHVEEDTVCNITSSIKRNGVTHTDTFTITVLAPVIGGSNLPRYGQAMFSDTDFTGGPEGESNENWNIPYTQWTGVQHFCDTVMTNILPSADSGQTFKLNLNEGFYGYFMILKSMMTLPKVQFYDNAVGMVGGMDGITWTPEYAMGDVYDGMEIEYDCHDGNGVQTWVIYRTDWDALGKLTYTVTF